MGKISDSINNMIQRMLESAEWTSANPTHINHLIQVNAREDPDFENDIKAIIREESKESVNNLSETDKLESTKMKKNVTESKEKIDDMLAGNVGDLKGFSREQFGNIRSVATNPFGFFTRTILMKLRTGAGVLFIVAIATEVMRFLIEELFKPGRMFDVRFREQIDKQIIQFMTRQEQEKLKAGYRSLITTTIGGLRGNSLRGQIGGNFYSSPLSGPHGLYDPSYIRFPSRERQDMRGHDLTQIPANEHRTDRGNIRSQK